MEHKTNAMRILTQKKISYQVHDYTNSDNISGLDVAKYFNEDPSKVFKTLVTVAKSKEHYVFLVPVSKTLDLKKSASVVKEKAIEMVKSKDLLSLTGYIHGGCSPIGMKKQYKTIIDISAKESEKIFISGGKIGYQIEIAVSDLEKIMPIIYADIC